MSEELKALILERERTQARELAGEIIFKPQLSVWMILIPVIFIYYFWRFQQYSQGTRDFIRNYLHPREAALDEAEGALRDGRKPDIGPLIPQDNLPREAVQPYAAWLRLLVEHYIDLLKTDGSRVDACIRKCYSNRTNYLLYLNRLKKAEARLNEALMPGLTAGNSDVPETIQRMEACCEKLRRKEATRIFP